MAKQFKKHCFVSDNDGHNYLIPYTLKKQYDCLCEALERIEEDTDEWYNIIEQFNDTFEEYRHDDIFNTPFYLEVD